MNACRDSPSFRGGPDASIEEAEWIIDECVPRLAFLSRDSWRPRRQH
jgi:hypothetical protein